MNALKTILLVEDSPEDADLTLGVLTKQSLANQVTVARDGVEAVDYLYRRGEFEGRGEGNPVVMLLDIKMPRMDGLEVLHLIKRDPDLRNVPIVMLTSSRETADLIKSYELGVNAYVVKPLEFDQFSDAIKQIADFWVLLNEPPPHQ